MQACGEERGRGRGRESSIHYWRVQIFAPSLCVAFSGHESSPLTFKCTLPGDPCTLTATKVKLNDQVEMLCLTLWTICRNQRMRLYALSVSWGTWLVLPARQQASKQWKRWPVSSLVQPRSRDAGAGVRASWKRLAAWWCRKISLVWWLQLVSNRHGPLLSW